MINMKEIKVVAAVIHNPSKTEVFATRRGYGEFECLWEFPGGKIELNETPQQALIREIKEELAVDILVNEFITTVIHDYPTFRLIMDCFWCEIVNGNITLIEASSAKWLAKNELDTVNWLEADRKLLPLIYKGLKEET